MDDRTYEHLMVEPMAGALGCEVSGVELDKPIRPEIVSEINGMAGTMRGTPPPGTENRSRMTFGLRYTRRTVRLDGGLTTGFTSRDPRVGLTAGLTWVFESFLSP